MQNTILFRVLVLNKGCELCMVLHTVEFLLQDGNRTLNGKRRKMEAKDAVHAAKGYVAEMFADEGLAEIGLEEISSVENDCWKITIGFVRSWDRSVIPILRGQDRSYKVVTINDIDGRVLSIKDRALAETF